MSKAGEVSERRLRKVHGVLLTNADPEGIPDEVAEWVIQHPVEAGQQFALWLKNRCRLIVGEPKILRFQPSVTFSPSGFLSEGWTIWKGPKDGNGLEGGEDCDRREDNLSEIDFSQALFETCLEEGETTITGEEKLMRMKASGHLRLGGRTFLSLWQDYQANKGNSILEWLYQNGQITYMDFFGLVLRSPLGDRYVLYLCRYDDSQWYWHQSWLGRGCGARNRSVSLASD